ncbi:EF-hand domain-containing protein [Piscinibacter terrae]|nr:EF-hand domain-containing protein [Albitalea terrae]
MTRSLLALVLAPVVLASAGLTAVAQTKAPATEQPVAAKDKAVIESAFAKADANGDGKLSKDEAAKLPAIGARFDELDKNKDGVLTVEEFSAGFATN